MDLIADRGRRVTVEELNTTQLLRHARKQAVQRNLDDILIVDVDAHHYENENYGEFLPFMENDVLKQIVISGRAKGRHGIIPSGTGYQDMGGRFYSMLCVPFSDADEALRHVETFGHRKHVGGFMVTTVRSHMGVHDNAYMKVYRAIEERGLVLSFHSGPNWGEPIFKSCNRFMAVHALGFTWYNVLHLTNWVINGLGEHFPKLPIIWIESGLAWVPFLMQRLDHEYMLRPSEAPLLKKKPSDYMRDMYYSSQPMEIQDKQALECTFRMINAETQLLYSSDYPHWDFDLPSTICDLPFLSEKAKHNILGGTAARLFKLPPRNEKQKENLTRFGNLHAAAA